MCVGIALGNFRGNGDQSAIFQFAHRGCRRCGQRNQFGQQYFTALLHHLPYRLLPLRQFREFAVRGQRPHQQALAPSGVFLAHRFGQHGFQRGFGGATVITTHPASQGEHFRGNQRLRTNNFQNRFEAGIAGFLGHGGNHAQDVSRTEGNLHTAADFYLARQFRRNRIIKFLAQRDLQADTGDHFNRA